MILYRLFPFIKILSLQQIIELLVHVQIPVLCASNVYKKTHFIVCLNTLNLNFGYEKDNYIARIYENNVKSFEILWVKGGRIR